MTKRPQTKTPPRGTVVAEPITVASVLAALERPGALSATRLRDLRSAVKRVADLLGNEPAAIALNMEAISVGLTGINPLAVDMTAKRFANIRSDFVAAVRASGVMPVMGKAKNALSAAWAELFKRLSGRRRDLGLSRLGHFASAQEIEPGEVDDEVIDNFIAAVRARSLHQQPNALHRQVTLIWNEAARDPALGLRPVAVASFRGPPKRIDWALLPDSFRQDVDDYLSWCGGSDPFAADARSRALALRTLRLRRDMIHAAATALVESGTKPATIRSFAELVMPDNVKKILRRRLEIAGGEDTLFNHDLGRLLLQITGEWVKADPSLFAELKRLAGKLPGRSMGLTDKNKKFLRQFDDPKALRRLVQLPEKLWAEVKRDGRPNFRTLAKAQTALAIGILTYMPLRLQNLSDLAFDRHLFIRTGAGAISTLELSKGEVKNKTELAFDIPLRVAKMLAEYRDRIAPKIIGHRPVRLFVNVDGTPKSEKTVAWLIASYAKRRAGVLLSSHKFRHLAARVLLDAQPGAFALVREILGHKRDSSTVTLYSGVDSRRAARHHQNLIDKAIGPEDPSRLQK
jgi:integrase